jgi:hypothetical protein
MNYLLSWDLGERHLTGLDRHMVLRLLWDPGGAAAAWGQAAFQGGRGVRDPSYMSSWAGTWAVLMGLTTRQQPVYRNRTINGQSESGDNIQKDHGGEQALSLPVPCFSEFPILATLFFPNPY